MLLSVFPFLLLSGHLLLCDLYRSSSPLHARFRQRKKEGEDLISNLTYTTTSGTTLERNVPALIRYDDLQSIGGFAAFGDYRTIVFYK